MAIYRLYTGDDGHSHISALTLASHPELRSPGPATGAWFRESPAGDFQDWHPAPRRQWVIILRGQLEIGLSDGSLHRFGPGDARLVEDTTGAGHTTRVVGDGPCLAMYVPVGEGVPRA
jgi:hypothetical protein